MLLESSLSNSQALNECFNLDISSEVRHWQHHDPDSFWFLYPLVRNLYATYLRAKYPLPISAFVPRDDMKHSVNLPIFENIIAKEADSPTSIEPVSPILIFSFDPSAFHIQEVVRRMGSYGHRVAIHDIVHSSSAISADNFSQCVIFRTTCLAHIDNYFLSTIGKKINPTWLTLFLRSIAYYFLVYSCVLANTPPPPPPSYFFINLF